MTQKHCSDRLHADIAAKECVGQYYHIVLIDLSEVVFTPPPPLLKVYIAFT